MTALAIATVKKTIVGTTILLSSLAFTAPTFAAAPDGNGPWADSVLSSSQGTMKNGLPVPAARSNPTAALGVAENNTTETNFFSLGFGGNIALGFDNGISSGVIVVEATNPGYPTETAKVEVSENGTTWVLAGNVSQDGQVNKPASISCARYVRVTDTSDPNNFTDATADGYDVDGVQATGEPCTPPTSDCCDCGCTNVTQTNNSVVLTSITSKAKTGGNSANNNTGTGSAVVATGNATNNVNVSVTGNTNSVSGTGCCCDGAAGTNVTISGNGAGSRNTVIINKGKKPSQTPTTFRFGR